MTPTWWRTDAVEWQSHGWQLELRGDEIAEIRHHGTAVLRAVRAAVRDRGWLTVPVAVRSAERGAETLTLTLQHEGLGARVSSTLEVRASEHELVITWDAVNELDVDTCRIGLVALHPATEAGRTAVVVHADGSEERTSFPREISPHQPILDIRELRVDDGPSFVFAGDVFEMEDQRNWSDASFKTYSRPLALPYPYALPAGERVRQSITIAAPPVLTPESSITPADPVMDLTAIGPFPDIGVEASTAPDPVVASDLGGFRAVELDLRTPTWRSALARARLDGVPLDVRVVSEGDRESADAVAAALGGAAVLRLAPFDSILHITTPALAETFRDALETAGLDVPVVGGARSHFTELNREHSQIARDVAGIVVTTTPLFHTLDTEQLVEALAMQRIIAEQTVRIADGLGVHIGPVSLRPRFNNVATAPEPAPTREDLAEGYGSAFTGASDDRQSAPELGAWLVASAAALAVPGVDALSWFETWGPRGLTGASGRTPAAAAIDALCELRGSTLLSAPSPDGLVWAIGGRCDGADVVLVANLDRAERSVGIRLPESAVHTVVVEGGGWTRIAR